MTKMETYTRDRFTASAIRIMDNVWGISYEPLWARYSNGRVSFYSQGNTSGWSTTPIDIGETETLADALNDRHSFQRIKLATEWFKGETTAHDKLPAFLRTVSYAQKEAK